VSGDDLCDEDTIDMPLDPQPEDHFDHRKSFDGDFRDGDTMFGCSLWPSPRVGPTKEVGVFLWVTKGPMANFRLDAPLARRIADVLYRELSSPVWESERRYFALPSPLAPMNRNPRQTILRSSEVYSLSASTMADRLHLLVLGKSAVLSLSMQVGVALDLMRLCSEFRLSLPTSQMEPPSIEIAQVLVPRRKRRK